jgi:antitoxin Phd
MKSTANSWQLQNAKSKFSRLVEQALQDGPQFVTRHGNNAVVVLSYKQFQELTKPQTDLVGFLRTSPLSGMDLDIVRDKNHPRDIAL